MPRSYQTLEVSSFTKGLITEASPLTFPEGSAIALDNFELNRNGSVSRRLGMEERSGSVASTTTFTSKSALTSLYEWDSPGGLIDRPLLAVQDGPEVRIFDRAGTASGLELNQIASFNIGVSSNERASFASADGVLIVASGEDVLHRAEFDGTTVSVSTFRLNIRDVFGVDDGLSTGMSVTTRPTPSALHTYNLRNQSWANRRKFSNTEVVGDPLVHFSTVLPGVSPSNADTVTQALFADTADADDRVGRRFFAEEVINNPVGSTEAARGFFIIDALNRGSSRLSQVQELQVANGYTNAVTSLPADKTPGGASVVQEYAGRVFYAGFSGAVQQGDSRSPQLASYLLFSRLVRGPGDVGECYTAADPTSPDDPEQVATDGGYVRIDGASNIVGLVQLRESLYILAENGVWSLNGGGSGFSSTNMVVNKVTDKGVVGNSATVSNDQSIFYWSESGIFAIAPNEFGDYHPNNISNNTIQSLFDRVPFLSKQNAVGVFDSYEQKVRWVYDGNKELILDLNLNAFYVNTFNSSKDIRGVFLVPAYRPLDITEAVRVNGEIVTVNGEALTVTFEGRSSGLREVAYLLATDNSDLTTITFGTLSDNTFRDYASFDAKASLITGYSSLGDNQRYKDIPYLTLHFNRTEDGFTSEFVPTRQSSCMTRVAWEWANSEASGRWTRQFQGYRYRRLYLPDGADSGYDTGFATIITKNKLRGKGKVFSIHMETEPLKDLQLLGWSLVVGVAGNV